MPAFGLTGPWRDRVGFAPTMEQIAGLAWVTGLPDGPPVAPRGACDPLAGTHAAFALMAALEFAERTGRGQLVEVPMIESVLNVTAVQTMEFEVFGSVLGATRQPGTSGASGRTSTGVRATTTGSRSPYAPTTKQHALAELMGEPAADPAQWFATQEAADVVERLAEAGIPAAVVVSPSLVTENPQLIHRGFFERLDHPSTGPGPVPVSAFRPSRRHDKWLHRTPPTLGQHNSEVLTELCGLTDADLDRLAADGRHRHQAEGAVRRGAYRASADIAISSKIDMLLVRLG